jgi:hypothetical protein
MTQIPKQKAQQQPPVQRALFRETDVSSRSFDVPAEEKVDGLSSFRRTESVRGVTPGTPRRGRWPIRGTSGPVLG